MNPKEQKIAAISYLKIARCALVEATWNTRGADEKKIRSVIKMMADIEENLKD